MHISLNYDSTYLVDVAKCLKMCYTINKIFSLSLAASKREREELFLFLKHMKICPTYKQ